MEDKVLIISHTFPPASGVGGRRWAKFAKYLYRNNIIPFILTSKSNGLNISLWNNDVTEIINVFKYKNFYPSILSKKHLNFIEKVIYKIAILIVKFISKGNYFDKVVFDKNKIIREMDYLLKQNKINNLIISGAPFNLLYFGALYKQKNPNINFIADFRDPWTWGQNYGMALLKGTRKNFEMFKENFVIKYADTIFVPTGIMLDYLVKTYPKFESKIKLMPHGFDSEAIMPRSAPIILNYNKIKIAYIGELYDGIGDYMDAIASSIVDTNSPFFIDFYSSSKRYNQVFNKKSLIGSKVNYFPLIQSNELFKKIIEYDFILIIHPEYAKDYISTKFYEILYSRTPIIYISQKGITSHFIQNTQSGIFLELNQINEFFSDDTLVKTYHHKPCIDLEQYSLNNITKQIIKSII